MDDRRLRPSYIPRGIVVRRPVATSVRDPPLRRSESPVQRHWLSSCAFDRPIVAFAEQIIQSSKRHETDRFHDLIVTIGMPASFAAMRFISCVISDLLFGVKARDDTSVFDPSVLPLGISGRS